MSERDLIIKDNYLPKPPVGDQWDDKDRDHPSFQLSVSLASQFGGVSPSTGCLTPGADAARREAELAYYTRSEIHHDLILELEDL